MHSASCGVVLSLAVLFGGIVHVDGLSLYGQQQGLYSLQSADPFISHASYSSIIRQWGITGIYRDQWANIQGAPSTQYLHFFAPTSFMGLAYGMQLESDKIGLERHLRWSPSVATSWETDHWILSVGLKPQVHFLRVNGPQIRTPDGVYHSGQLNHNDPALSTQNEVLTTADAGLSFYFRTKFADVALSMDNLFQSRGKSGGMTWREQRFLRALIARAFHLNRFRLTPWLNTYTDFIRWQSEVSIDLDYNGSIFGGVMYRTPGQGGLVLKLGMPLVKNLFLAYAYDFPVRDNLFGSPNGGHEIMVQYRITGRQGRGKLRAVEYNPRYID